MNVDFATAWEVVAQTYPGRPVGICDGKVLTWGQYEQRAARLANLLAEHGLGADSKAGLYLHNCNEYLEAQFAIFKLGGCPINVNYRYKADELVYLLDNADVEAVFFQSCYAMRIWEIKDRLPKVKLFVQVDDGTDMLMDFAVDYERSIRDSQARPPQARDPEGIYMLYTGGTIGMPKGVMYPVGQFAGFLTQMGAVGRELPPPTNLQEYRTYLGQIEYPPVTVVGCPLMHGTGMWLGGFVPMMMGGAVVTTAKLGLDAHLLWSLVEQHRASDLVIVGDAFARPLLAALDDAKARSTPYDLRGLQTISSSGVMWSEETKQGLLRHHDLVLADIMGSTEGGMGSSITTRQSSAQTAAFSLNDGVKVIHDEGHEIVPGSGEIGRIATSAMVPLGYYKDAQKSAATFQVIDGVRYSFPGDYATVAADGTVTLLGRGSACINTGGEKVFPEEVEEALKRHELVADALVVGLPDERFGQRVVAVCSTTESVPELADILQQLHAHCGHVLAGYKAPREILLTETVQRAPNGKADYKWANKYAQQRTQEPGAQ